MFFKKNRVFLVFFFKSRPKARIGRVKIRQNRSLSHNNGRLRVRK